MGVGLWCVVAHSTDPFGKKVFPNPSFSAQPTSGPYFAGTVTPVLHYCMGGLHIDNDAHVLFEGPSPDAGGGRHGPYVPLPGLFAAGEVVGGIHGNNRLAGNALTECVVFGLIAAKNMDARRQEVTAGTGGAAVSTASGSTSGTSGTASGSGEGTSGEGTGGSRVISAAELQHNDGKAGRPLWAAIHGAVYDLTSFVEEHPGGPESIVAIGGKDGTASFDSVHSTAMLADFQPVGVVSS